MPQPNNTRAIPRALKFDAETCAVPYRCMPRFLPSFSYTHRYIGYSVVSLFVKLSSPMRKLTSLLGCCLIFGTNDTSQCSNRP